MHSSNTKDAQNQTAIVTDMTQYTIVLFSCRKNTHKMNITLRKAPQMTNVDLLNLKS